MVIDVDRIKTSLMKRRCILVCQNRSCQRQGSQAVLAEFKAQTREMPSVFVAASDCTGQCSSGPTVRVTPDQTWYCRVKATDVQPIVQQHLEADQPVQSLLHPRFHRGKNSFLPD